MLLAGEAGLAMEFATMLQLPASAVQIDPSVLAEQALHRTSTYLQMPLPRTSRLQEDLVPCHPSQHKLMHSCMSSSLKCCESRRPVTGIHLVETEEQIIPATDLLSNSTVLGVDCEWEPRFEASFGLGVDSSPTSILQVMPAHST